MNKRERFYNAVNHNSNLNKFPVQLDVTPKAIDGIAAEWGGARKEEELLDRITDYQVRIAERYVETGIDCGRNGNDYGTQYGMMFYWQVIIRLFCNRARTKTAHYFCIR